MKTANMRVLVTGGSGYIGSHVVKKLLSEGAIVFSIDKKNPPQKYDKNFTFIKGDIANKSLLEKLFKNNAIDVVVHLAALIRPDESMEKPLLYFKNNVSCGVVLLEAMKRFGIHHIIFASSCSVYGVSNNKAIKENFPCQPASMYGVTKSVFENILDFYSKDYGFSSISLRIFNASGLDPKGNLQENHRPETHVIPNILASLYSKKPIMVYGNNYKTKDGTCVRDYVHVNDISRAFSLAIYYALKHKTHQVFNIGAGRGYSVKEVIEAATLSTGKSAKVVFKKKRVGDQPFLVCDNTKAKALLPWKPQYNLEDIISHVIHSKYSKP